MLLMISAGHDHAAMVFYYFIILMLPWYFKC